jgi:hypothetical protein
MPNAWTMRPGAGRKAAPPKRDKPQAWAGRHYVDANAAQVADTLRGAEGDVLHEQRGPAWLRGWTSNRKRSTGITAPAAVPGGGVTVKGANSVADRSGRERP